MAITFIINYFIFFQLTTILKSSFSLMVKNIGIGIDPNLLTMYPISKIEQYVERIHVLHVAQLKKKKTKE